MKKGIDSTNYFDDQQVFNEPGSKASNGGIKLMGDLPGSMITAK